MKSNLENIQVFRDIKLQKKLNYSPIPELFILGPSIHKFLKSFKAK